MGGRGQWTAGVLWGVLAAVLADSWTAYQEQPCCRPVAHHRVRHHRGEFSESSHAACSDPLGITGKYLNNY